MKRVLPFLTLSFLFLNVNGQTLQTVTDAGNATTNPASFSHYLKITSEAGIQKLLIGNQNSNGVNKPGLIAGANGNIYFGHGDSWSDGGNLTYNMTLAGSNLGLGTMDPGAKLSFQNLDGNNTDGITWYSPGPLSYGIYRTAGAWAAPNYQQIRMQWETGIILDPGVSYGKSYVDVQGNGLRVTSGSVGIGTIDTRGYKLAVNGTIRAKEIKVEAGPWPDYVFEENYKPSTLADLEKFIKTNKHLPNIPSAAEVEKDGIKLGEMNAKLLEKIEELTLYAIAQDKKLAAQEKLVLEILKRLDKQ